MISTIITPDKTRVSLPVPPSYIGKRIEVTFALAEEPNKGMPKKKLSKMFRGTLSKESAENFLEHIKTMREEWDDL